MKTKKLNICLVYPGFPPENNLGGGISVFCKMLVDSLLLYNVTLTVISRSQNNSPSFETYKGVKIFRIPGNTRSSKFNANGVVSFSEKVKKLIESLEDKQSRFDIIEAVDWGGEAIALLPKYNNRLVIRCHTPGFIAETYNPKNLPYLSNEVKTIEKEVLLKAKHITSSSSILMKNIEENLGKKLNYYIQPIMIPKDKFIQKRKYAKEFNENNPMKIICCGRIEERKGFNRLVDCLNKLCEDNYHIQLDIYGSSTPLISGNDSKTELLKTVSSKNKKMISIKNKISHKKLLKLYSTYDLCIVPSLFESWSLVGVEAIQSGLPTLLSNACELVRFLPTSHSPLKFDTTNVGEIANKIKFVYNNYDICIKIAKKDRQAVIKRLNQIKIGKEILRYYEKISRQN